MNRLLFSILLCLTLLAGCGNDDNQLPGDLTANNNNPFPGPGPINPPPGPPGPGPAPGPGPIAPLMTQDDIITAVSNGNFAPQIGDKAAFLFASPGNSFGCYLRRVSGRRCGGNDITVTYASTTTGNMFEDDGDFANANFFSSIPIPSNVSRTLMQNKLKNIVTFGAIIGGAQSPFQFPVSSGGIAYAFLFNDPNIGGRSVYYISLDYPMVANPVLIREYKDDREQELERGLIRPLF